MRIEKKLTVTESIEKMIRDSGMNPTDIQCVRLSDKEWERFVQEANARAVKFRFAVGGGPFCYLLNPDYKGVFVGPEDISKYMKDYQDSFERK